MRSINHRKFPSRSYRNDSDFAFFEDFSASVLSTRKSVRFDGEFSANGQMAPAETILSGRAVALNRHGFACEVSTSATNPISDIWQGELTIQPEPCYRATLFDRVMDLLDRYDRMATRPQRFEDAE